MEEYDKVLCDRCEKEIDPEVFDFVTHRCLPCYREEQKEINEHHGYWRNTRL